MKSSFSRKLFYIILFLFFLSTFAFSKSTIHLYIFYSSDCPTCEIVNLKNIKKLGEKLKVKIEAKYFDIEKIENYQKLVKLEEKYKDTDNEIPVVFVGKYVLGGKEEIKKNLEKVIKEYGQKGGIDFPEEIIEKTSFLPESVKSQSHPVYIGFFYEFTCKECERIFYFLNYLKKTHTNLILKTFNLKERDNKIIFEAIAEKLKIPENKRLIPATVIVGTDYIQGKNITLRKIETLLAKYENTGSPCMWNLKEEEFEQAKRNIINRFCSFSIFTICFASLSDGINPCAFAVLIFFISFLTVSKRKKKEILLIGFSFLFAVFCIYFLIGCGAFSFLSKFTSYKIFSKVLNTLVGVGAIILGILSFSDFLKARKGEIKDISLQLPKLIKTKIHSTIMKKTSLPNYIFGAFLAGAIVSFLEFVCTGQVYLPTIVFVLNQPEFKVKGILYLLIYNFMFIFPLVIILLFSFFGTTSHKFSSILRKNLSVIKFILFLFFFFIGFYLLLKGLPLFLTTNFCTKIGKHKIRRNKDVRGA